MIFYLFLNLRKSALRSQRKSAVNSFFATLKPETLKAHLMKYFVARQ